MPLPKVHLASSPGFALCGARTKRHHQLRLVSTFTKVTCAACLRQCPASVNARTQAKAQRISDEAKPNKALVKAFRTFPHLLPVPAGLPSMHWRSCATSMPECNTTVLVGWNDIDREPTTSSWILIGTHQCWKGVGSHYPSHWMPFPPSPRQKKRGDGR